MKLTLSLKDCKGKVIAKSTGTDFVDLVVEREYAEGDTIVLETSEKDVFIRWQVDDALAAGEVFVKDNTVDYIIPFGEKRVSMSERVFTRTKHYLYAEKMLDAESSCYRNIALNPIDQHREIAVYPHATANVETRGESVFAAKNAIDGVRANLSHGEWPYASWGINKQADAALKLEFGREVTIDKIVLYTRSDFPHDAWWNSVHFSFSDGSEETFPLKKSVTGHVLELKERKISWLVFDELKKAVGPSPFPALTQIEVYGK